MDQDHGLVQLIERGKDLTVDLDHLRTGQEEIALSGKVPEDERNLRATVREAAAARQAPTEGEGRGVRAQELETEAVQGLMTAEEERQRRVRRSLAGIPDEA